jgi:hypothetical protein
MEVSRQAAARALRRLTIVSLFSFGVSAPEYAISKEAGDLAMGKRQER